MGKTEKNKQNKMGFHLQSYLQGVAHDLWREGHSVSSQQSGWVMCLVCRGPTTCECGLLTRPQLHLEAVAILLASFACEKFRTSTVDQDHLFHFYKFPSVGILWSDVTCFLFYTEPPPLKKSYEYMGPQR